MGESIKDIAALSPTKRALFELLLKEKGLNVAKIQKIPRERGAQCFPLSFAQQRLWFLDQLEPGNSAYNETAALRLQGVLNVPALGASLNEIVRRHEILRTTFATVGGEPVQIINNFDECASGIAHGAAITGDGEDLQQSPIPNAQCPMPNSLTLEIVDLRHILQYRRESEFWQLSAQKAHQPFDLTKGPLIRATLFQLGETASAAAQQEQHALLLVAHHTVSDGWSSRVLVREMAALYEAYCAGIPSPLPELPIQYADFAVWQRQWLTGGGDGKASPLQSLLSYWKEQLAGASLVLEVPASRPRPAVLSGRSGRHSLMLSEKLSESVKALSRESGATLFMTLLAAFGTLLYRHTGQEDIIIGSPSAGRNRAEIEPLIGFFINTLVLRTNLGGNPSFRELLGRVRPVALGAFAHQDMPFEKLVEELQPQRDLSRTPLFQVFFNLLNLEGPSAQGRIEMAGVTAETLPRPEQDSKFDLTLYAREKKEGIELEFVYSADLFEPARMADMLAQFSMLLAQIVKNPDEKIAHFSLLTPAAAALLPDPAQPLVSEWFEPAHARVYQQAKRVPERLAVADKTQVLTYWQLDATSNQIANYLLSHGIGCGDAVAIYAHRSALLVVAVLGILKAGAAFTILDANYPAERLIDCLEAASPKGWLQMEAAGPLPPALEEFVATSSWSCRLALPQKAAVCHNLLRDYSTETPEITVDPDDLAYIAFTSGSTGKPKGILGTHRPISHFLQWHIQTFNLNESDRFSMLSGLSHDPLLRDIFTPLWLGGTLLIPDPDSIGTPGWLLDWMKQMQISVAHLTPAMGQLLSFGVAEKPVTEVPPGEGDRRDACPAVVLRYAFFGGDVLTSRDVARIRKLAPNVTCVNFYGATETPQAMGYYIVPHQEAGEHGSRGVRERERKEDSSIENRIPVGVGIRDVQLLVLNASGQLAGIGELGEIYIRTPYLAKGYLGDDELLQSRFQRFAGRNISPPLAELMIPADDRLYKTGDLGRYNLDGTVAIAGRADSQVKIRGFRIELGEIAGALALHPGVLQCAVIAREDVPGEKRLVAYVVANPEMGEVLSPPLRSFLREKLPDYMVPSAFVILEALPLTPNGKLDRRALPVPELVLKQGQPDRLAAGAAPKDMLERQLTEIWEKVLGVSPISVTDNFFDLGGHSLLAVKLFAQILESLGKALPLATLFSAPTVEQLANILRQDGWLPAWKSLVPIQTGSIKTPLFCIHAIGGNVLSYQGLASYLGENQPVYGLQARGLDGQEEPHRRVEDMAADYIKEIRTVQLHGPYFLAGHSLGGIVAFEIAQQLAKAGERVALLALFDTFSPMLFNKETPPFRYQLSIHKLNLSRLKPTERLSYVTDRVKWKIEGLRQKLTDKFYLWSGLPNPDLIPEIFRLVEEANRQAVRNYLPQVYPGRVTLFRSIERPTRKYYDPLLGWGELAAGGVEVVEVPGHHKTLILEPYVRFLAEKLRACLDKAQAEG
ncbi:MAG: amino acid adenylation domain-containing protein [Oscillatoria princeps RMCB-10]|jgi:amino acid adenylation domain-containing protein|nr:amino acid adenylation domain-containing protein [Oscillatoria princeps RMCB-10]